MRAHEMAEPYPVVSLTTDVLTAAHTMGDVRMPGLIVCDDDGRPRTVLPGSKVLKFMIPSYIQDDPALARVHDDASSLRLMTRLANRTVADLLPPPKDRDELPVVDPDATVLEVAAVMARMHSPIVAVVDGDRVVGAITASRMFEVLFPVRPSDDELPDADGLSGDETSGEKAP